MRLLLTLLWTALLAVPTQAQSSGSGKKNRLIIGFKIGTDAPAREAILKRFGLDAVEARDLGALNLVVVEAAAGKVAPSAFRLMSDPAVFHVEEDFYTNWLAGVGSLHEVPFPTLRSVMADLPKLQSKDATEGEMPWGIARVKAQSAWERTQGDGVKVAVVDTGIDFKHPDLAANYAGGTNVVDSKKSPMDDNGHGTHVAGTIAAVKDGQGVVGVAPKAKLYAVKVLDGDGGGNLSGIVKGILWCADNGIQVANMSLGAARGSIFMRMALVYAKYKGVVVVAAAGNSGGDVSYPGAYEETLAVSASDSSDKIAEFSSRGKQVDFIAPGVGVKSSIPGGGYDRYSGTSMATPHVAGLAALAVSQGASGLAGVKAMLGAAAKPLAGLKPEEQGAGMIDAGLIRKR
ncbi:MAG: S8 family peptidase [Elusimicrobiota bacterium]